MTARVVGIEARRGFAPLLVLLVAIESAFLLSAHPADWAASWPGLGQALRDSTAACAALIVAVGVWLGSRERRRGMVDLLASTSRPRWRRLVATGIPLAVAASLGLLITGGLAAVLVAPHASYVGGRWWLDVILAVLGLGAATAAGLAIGRLASTISNAVGRMLLAPVAGIATYIGVLTLQRQPPTSLPTAWNIANASIGPFQRIAYRGALGQGVWLVGLAAGLLIVAGARRAWVGLAPIAVAAVVSAALLPSGLNSVIGYDPSAIQLICTGTGPRICLTREHQHLAGQIRDLVTTTYARLPASLDMPATVAESGPFHISTPRGSLTLSMPSASHDITLTGSLSDSGARSIRGAVVGNALPECDFKHENYEGALARATVTAFLTGGQDGAGAGDPNAGLLRDLRSMTPAAAGSRITRYLRTVNDGTCGTASLDALR